MAIRRTPCVEARHRVCPSHLTSTDQQGRTWHAPEGRGPVPRRLAVHTSFPVRRAGRVFAAILGSLVVALLGALAGALIAVALTVWAVPDDPFAIVLGGLGLLLLWVPLGALFAVWLLSLLADESPGS